MRQTDRQALTDLNLKLKQKPQNLDIWLKEGVLISQSLN